MCLHAIFIYIEINSTCYYIWITQPVPEVCFLWIMHIPYRLIIRYRNLGCTITVSPLWKLLPEITIGEHRIFGKTSLFNRNSTDLDAIVQGGRLHLSDTILEKHLVAISSYYTSVSGKVQEWCPSFQNFQTYRHFNNCRFPCPFTWLSLQWQIS